MTKALKASGFLGLAVMMVAGLYMSTILAGGDGVPAWLVGGHAHLGVLSILAIVLGFVVEAYDVTGTLRTGVEVAFILGQWGVPLIPVIAVGLDLPMLHPTVFLWGTLLIVSMLAMVYVVVTEPNGASRLGRGT